jgi:hypothetical protein
MLHDILRDNTKVEGRAGGRLDQLRSGAEADNELVAGRALKVRGNLLERGRYAPASYDLQFDSTHCNAS